MIALQLNNIYLLSTNFYMAGNHLFFVIAEVLDGEVVSGVSLGNKPCQRLGHLCIDNIMTFAIGEGKDIEILHETEFADAIG